MTSFDARTFLVGLDHLDSASRELFGRHGKRLDGRACLIERLVDEAMLRLAAQELESEEQGADVEH